MTSKTISGSIAHGVTLTTATYDYNPLYVTGTINTATGDGVYGDSLQAWTVDNTGTITAAAGDGVALKDGGSVTNGASGAASALISGYDAAIYIKTAAGTVANFATLLGGANGDGVFFYDGGGSVTNGASTITGALISAGNFGILAENAAATVTNFATVAGGAYGVHLDGGTVTNGSSTAQSARISGGDGVGNAGGSLTLTNYGTIKGTTGPATILQTGTANSITNFGLIDGTGTNSGGIQLAASASGVITNGASTAVIAGGVYGVKIKGSNATVTNLGAIEAIGSVGVGVYLGAGGSVSNGATGAGTPLIEGAAYGVEIRSSAGTVANFGAIEGTGVGGAGVYLAAGGSVTNGASGLSNGLITGGDWGVKIGAAEMTAGSGGALNNFGTIEATGGINQGVYLPLGGIVTNGASGATTALIEGDFGVDIARDAGTGTVTNFGTIEGISGSEGLSVGGTAGLVTNGASGSGAALIEGGTGLSLAGAGATVLNFGTIAGTASGGIGISVGGTGGTVVNFGTIESPGGGVRLDGGDLTNGGSSATGAVINSGTGVAVYNAGGPLTLTNYGTIVGTASGLVHLTTVGSIANLGTIEALGNLAVYLQAGGSVTNGRSGASGALIVGVQAGIGIQGTLGGTVTNFGTIEEERVSGTVGNGIGIDLTSGSAVIDTNGLILGYAQGLNFRAVPSGGTVTNSGTVEAIGTVGIGVFFAGSNSGTVVNSGTIIGSSGTAVQFGTADNRLIIDPGAVFQGEVVGGAGTSINTIELAAGTATGTLSGFGTSFTNFTVLTVDPGAGWKLTGNTIGSGVTLTDSGSLFNAGSIAAEATLTAAAYLDNLAGDAIAAATAIKASGGAATVVNLGTVQGTSGSGIYLGAGGTVTNGASGGTTAFISGSLAAIEIKTEVGTVANFGTLLGGVDGSGVFLYNGGGAVTNGASGATDASISAGNIGILVENAAATVTNFATVSGAAGGVSLDGGMLANGTSGGGALISGFYGIANASGSLTLTNYGAIVGTSGPGIMLQTGTANSISNSGTISSTGSTGSDNGVRLSSGAVGTIVDSGTIAGASGAAAIVFGGSAGSNLLVLEHGYKLVGDVQGATAGASNTLELSGSLGAVTVNYNSLTLSHFQDVLFGASGNDTLKVSNTAGTLPVTISGFATSTGTIDLTGLLAGTLGNGGTVNGSDRLIISSGTESVALQLDGSDAMVFRTAPDGATGTDVTVACFCRGTLILTEGGEVAVEDLAIGDRVVTLSGAARSIKWIGRRAYDGRFVGAKRAVLPIRIEAGALADGMPARDLCVSPEHALLIPGSSPGTDVLVPAGLLANGLTIQQEERVERVEYFHIELEAHDIIFAEGMPAETFVDCDNRLMFQNGAEYARLYPDDAPVPWQFCALRLDAAAPELLAIRAALLARAEALGHRLDPDPDLHLIVDGCTIWPDSIAGERYRFRIPAGSASAWLASRSAVPAEIETGSRDHRRLGVPVERIALSDGELSIEAWHGDAALSDGFHTDEGSHRWTDGMARLPKSWLRSFLDGAVLEVRLAASGLAYRVPPPARIAA